MCVFFVMVNASLSRDNSGEPRIAGREGDYHTARQSKEVASRRSQVAGPRPALFGEGLALTCRLAKLPGSLLARKGHGGESSVSLRPATCDLRLATSFPSFPRLVLQLYIDLPRLAKLTEDMGPFLVGTPARMGFCHGCELVDPAYEVSR